MFTELESLSQRIATFRENVLLPAVTPARTPLVVGAAACGDAVRYEQALALDYTLVQTGFRFGPVWSTCWFRLSGRIPDDWPNVALRFDCGTEALLWNDGVPYHGLGPNHDTVRLGVEPGDEVQMHIEAACNRPLGATLFWWDEREALARWNEDEPGRLDRCELVSIDETMWQLSETMDFARRVMLIDDTPTARTRTLAVALDEVIRMTDPAAPSLDAPAALERLERVVGAGAASTSSTCHAVGHAHIDTAWLWRVRETRRKCMRTFATVLRLMERDDDFRFTCSQAQHYALLEESSPRLFDEVADRVREGRWEPIGGMWIEPDCNVPSGESLIRQLQHGIGYWRERFGDDAPQRVLYLPDTFGFPPCLPQLMQLAGLDTFITNKLSWNDTNPFPFVSFRWRGLDGSDVLAHCTPGHDYNATPDPAALARGERNDAAAGEASIGTWLQPYGFGNGGGGPTESMLAARRLAENCDGLPRVRSRGIREFAETLHATAAERAANGRALPVWDGELYLELHRGTLTTQSWLKRANRAAESGLRAAEWLGAFGPQLRDEGTEVDLAAELDATWKLVLLNQFHDILPGTSIASVYADARRDHELARSSWISRIDEELIRWAMAIDTSSVDRPVLVANPGSVERSGVVDVDGALHWAPRVPALGITVIDAAADDLGEEVPVSIDGRTLSNGNISVTIDDSGAIASLKQFDVDRDAVADRAAPLNRLVLYDDHPRFWEAWDIDAEYERRAEPIDDRAATIESTSRGDLRGEIRVERSIGRASRIVQRYVLDAGSKRVDIHTQIDWAERRRLLRALFPIDVRARFATYGTQFGHIVRSTGRATSHERAMYEVCAHGWMDVSEPGFGVALLDDGRYGHSCDGSTMGLSLVRGPVFPDPDADLGTHEFTYSLVPHGGDWRVADIDREAEALGDPLLAHEIDSGGAGGVSAPWSPFRITVTGQAGVTVSAATLATRDRRRLVRLAETRGARGTVVVDWSLPVRNVSAVDLLERAGGPEVEHSDRGVRSRFEIKPFQVVTLAAELE